MNKITPEQYIPLTQASTGHAINDKTFIYEKEKKFIHFSDDETPLPVLQTLTWLCSRPEYMNSHNEDELYHMFPSLTRFQFSVVVMLLTAENRGEVEYPYSSILDKFAIEMTEADIYREVKDLKERRIVISRIESESVDNQGWMKEYFRLNEEYLSHIEKAGTMQLLVGKNPFGEVDLLASTGSQTASRLNQLNEQQRQAVTFSGKHLLVLAGAGTGKTRTIIERALFLIDQGVPAHRIMILSFTRKSAREIVERIRLQSDQSLTTGLTGQTFHSWCMSLVKGNPDIFRQSDYTVLDEDDRSSCFKLLCGKRFKDKDGKSLPPDTILEVYSYVMNTGCSLSDGIRRKVFDSARADDMESALYIDKNKSIYEDIIRKYISYKEEHKYMDYDDILHIVARGLKNNQDAADFISGKYDHILVDEFQDTNPLQYQLLSSFYERCHLFCVGDDAQSIYGFRGADFQSIHHFTEMVPGAEKCKLTVNYRSTQEILDLSNWLLDASPLSYDKSLQAHRGTGIKPVLIHWRDEWEEAGDITDRILASVKSDNCKWSDNMVLSRSMFGLKKVEGACIRKGIPYKVYGGTSLMQSAHVRDVVSAMRIVSNFRDEIAWMRYLQLWKGIGNVSATRILTDMMAYDSLDECLPALQAKRLQPEIAGTLMGISDLQYSPAASMHSALKLMEGRLKEKYLDEWAWRKEDFPILEEVAAHADSVTEFIADYVLDPKLEESMKQPGKDEDRCILSTIHSAKGLEAAQCFVVNVSPYAYPSNRALLNGPDAVEEERRCLYVALTRTKDRLFVYRNVTSLHACQADDGSADTYFLNTLPQRLTDAMVIGQSRYPSDGFYKRSSVFVENDFNFD